MEMKELLREDLWKAVQAHYEKEDFTEALRDAMFFVCDLLRDKSGQTDKDGVKLVESTLLGNNPPIQVNKNETTSEKDFQQGIGFSIKGLMLSVRNPMSHEKKEFSSTEADAILLYTNYLINTIDKSGGAVLIDNFMELLTDKLFTETDEYADLLLKEIPAKKRYDFALELFQNRSGFPQNKLRSFINKLLLSLSKAEMQAFCRVISKTLVLCQDDMELRMYLHYFMLHTYQNIDKLARLRIEQMVKNSIQEGKFINGNCKEGTLAGWVSGERFYLLGNKDSLRNLLFNKIEKGKAEEDYVWGYFSDVLFPDEFAFTERQIKIINAKLLEGDKRYVDEIECHILLGEQEYADAFKESCEAGKKKTGEETSFVNFDISDLPF